jgi:hypothetical protein
MQVEMLAKLRFRLRVKKAIVVTVRTEGEGKFDFSVLVDNAINALGEVRGLLLRIKKYDIF